MGIDSHYRSRTKDNFNSGSSEKIKKISFGHMMCRLSETDLADKKLWQRLWNYPEFIVRHER